MTLVKVFMEHRHGCGDSVILSQVLMKLVTPHQELVDSNQTVLRVSDSLPRVG